MSKNRQPQELYRELKVVRDRHVPLWQDISQHTGIRLDPQFLESGANGGSKGDIVDEFVDDPTTAISVNQHGDYLAGVMWGTGESVFDVVPSRYVLEHAEPEELEDWYSFMTDQSLYHMNHEEAGFINGLSPYAYEQASFGTSGIGTFPNSDFMNGNSDNALLFRNYGVDNSVIDEGKNGIVEYVFTGYKWRINRIIGEFAITNGEIDEKKFNKLPKRLREAHTNGNFTEEFPLVFGMFPRDDFDPRTGGERAAKYKGVWFLDDSKSDEVFSTESFESKPIAICRQIKLRNEAWGRSTGTLLISSIKSVNFMVSTVIEILEKMSNPSLGIMNNALFGDSVLDTSPTGLSVFNQSMTGGSGNPIFPLHDVGDPTGIINFLIPYLNEKITTAFKIDSLLDFNTGKEMTATESMQRFTIRGKSISGLLQQQKTELLIPTAKRAISILWNMGELGVKPDDPRAQSLRQAGRVSRVIPQAVLDTKASGRPWFELRWNNELERLIRTEKVQSLLQLMQSIGAIAGMYPQIIESVDWYELLADINDNLDSNNQILIGAEAFKQKLQAMAEQQQAAAGMQAQSMAADTDKSQATATKIRAEADNA